MRAISDPRQSDILIGDADQAGYCVVIQSGPCEDVYCVGFDRARQTAERIIRERDAGRGTTWCSIVGPLTKYPASESVAHVRMDAFGRVWTDVMPEGAVLL